MEVQLTASEERIFQVLLAAVEHCNIGTQMRVAGGWVRDKLLGVPSHDIDIALDNRTGKKFREEILGYLKNVGALTSEGYIVPKNPECSKHLESSAVELYGELVEFVNLRSEGYTVQDNIPDEGDGNPMEDAFHRDLTINSLFYNLSTQLVEDFTGNGVADLEAGLIRTPLSPFKTFSEDPLRVLRAARFASGLGFKLDLELKRAALSPEIQHVLRTGIKRERVVEEGKRMIFGKDPRRAMQLIRELGCIDILFPVPVPTPGNWESSGVEYMLAASELMNVLEVSDESLKGVVALAGLLLPLKDCTYTLNNGKTIPLCTHVIKDCLLYNDNVGTEVASLLAALGNPHMDSWFKKCKSELAIGKVVGLEGDVKVEVGLLLNDLSGLKGARGSFKKNSLEAFVALMTVYKCQASEERLIACKAVKASIISSGLSKMKCLLNGKDVMEALGITSGNSEIGSWLRRVLVWQLQNTGASASDCKKWIQDSVMLDKGGLDPQTPVEPERKLRRDRPSARTNATRRPRTCL